MFSLFRKKNELKIPSPPSDEGLPSFPSPKGLERLSPEDLEEAAGAQLSLEEHKKRIVTKEKAELAEIKEHHVTRPIFIHAPTYKALVDEISQMKANMIDADEIILNLENCKGDQDKAFRAWQSLVKEIHEKLLYADATLFKR